MYRTLIVLALLALSLEFISAATLTGKVVGTDGTPIRGASVLLQLYDQDKSLELITDAAGNYTGEVDTPSLSTHDPRTMLFAWAPGSVLSSSMLEAKGNVITLNAGVSLSGTVTDAVGQPLAGVPVRLEYLQDEQGLRSNSTLWVPEEWRARVGAVSGADGSWTLTGMPRTGIVTLALDGDRYVHEEQIVTLFDGRAMTAVHFTARPGAVLSGRVLTSNGTPAGGVHVDIEAPYRNTASARADGKTTADGRYRFAGLASGSYGIQARKNNGVWNVETLTGIVLSEGKETVAPDLHMHAGAVLTGRVLTPQGTPAVNARLFIDETVRAQRVGTWAYARTGADGRFHIDGLATDSYTIRTVSMENDWIVDPRADIALTDGKETRVADLQAHFGAGVEGKLVDAESGLPVAGPAHVMVNTEGVDDYRSARNYCYVRKDGHFLCRIPPGRVTLFLQDPPYGYLPQQDAEALSLEVQEGKTATVTVKVHRGQSVTGTLLDGEGKPAVGIYTIRYHPHTEEGASYQPDMDIHLITDQQGHFKLDGLPAGKGTFVGLSSPDDWGLLAPADFALPAKTPMTLSLKHLTLSSVTGTATDEAGKPAAGVYVCYNTLDGIRYFNDTTDAQGHFAFTGVPEGKGTLTIQTYMPVAEWKLPAPLALDVPLKEPLVVSLKHNVLNNVTGSVTDGEGQPIAGAKGFLEMPGRRVDFTTDPGGKFALSGLNAGNGTLTLLPNPQPNEWETPAPLQIDIPSNEPITLRVTRLVMHTISGRVLDTRQHPLAGVTATFSVAYNDSPQTLTAVTGADGSYQLAKVPVGHEVSLLWLEQAGRRQPITGTLANAGKDTLDDAVLGDTLLEGTVQDAETGVPLPGARITLLDAGIARLDSWGTDNNGHFSYRFFRTHAAQIMLFIENPPTGYLKMKGADAVLVVLQEGKSVTAVLKLHRSQTVTGTVMDDAGKPVAGVNFRVRIPYHQDGRWSPFDTEVDFLTDQHGKFTVTNLPAGQGTCALLSNPDVWDLPEPLNIEVPAKEPMAITLTHVVQHTVRGRVVDSGHHPLAGVTATFSVTNNYSWWPQEMTAVTDKDGGYQLAKIPAGQKVTLLALELAGYAQPIDGVLTNAGSDRIADAVMMACTATVHGKVRDANGKPVKDATVVSVEGGRSARAVTDDTGAFTLSNQPACTLHLLAATPTGGGLATVNAPKAGAGTDILITCTPGRIVQPCDIALVQRLLDADSKLPRDQRRYNRSDTLRALADVDLELALRLSATGNAPVSEGLRAYLLARQAKKDPSQVNKLLVQLNMLKNPACKLYAAVEMGMAVANTDPELAEQLYHLAKPIYDQSAHGYDGIQSIEGLQPPREFDDVSLRIIALAELLHETADVDAMLAQLSTSIKIYSENSDCIIVPLVEAAGRVSPEFAVKVCDSFEDQSKYEHLGVAMTQLAQYDPDAALRLLKMIGATEFGDRRVDYLLLSLISALGAKDPAAVLALAKAQPEDMRPVALLEAAAFQP